VRIVAYKTLIQDGKVLLQESGGQFELTNDPIKLFEFLLEDYSPCIKVSWDLDSTVAPILRLLGLEACRQLRKTKRLHYQAFDLFYVPEKTFIIKHPQAKMSLYHLSQYYPELPEPDIEMVQKLGENLLKELAKMGMHPTGFTSPIKIYAECIMSKMDLPKLKDIPRKVGEFSYRAAARSWIESHSLGYFNHIVDYDLSAAYPSIVKELMDFRECEWNESSEYQGNAIYGYVNALMTIYDWVMVHPILRETEEGLDSPTGTWPDYFTKKQLDFVKKWGIGEYKIIEGVWATTNRKAFKKPLKVPTENLLKYKQGTAMQARLAKRMSSGIWGYTGADWGDTFGDSFNPVYFCEGSSQVALQVGEFLYSHGIGPSNNDGYKTLISVDVDGTKLTKEIDISKDSQWRLAYEGEALIISSGLVYTALTKPKGLHLGEVLEMIKAHPRQPYYEKKIKRRLTLGDALAQDRLNDLGKEMEFSVSINLLNQNHDRDFKSLPQTGEQLLKRHYSSKPIRI
jgi:hypothetical protein